MLRKAKKPFPRDHPLTIDDLPPLIDVPPEDLKLFSKEQLEIYIICHGLTPELTKPRMKAQLRDVIRKLKEQRGAVATATGALGGMLGGVASPSQTPVQVVAVGTMPGVVASGSASVSASMSTPVVGGAAAGAITAAASASTLVPGVTGSSSSTLSSVPASGIAAPSSSSSSTSTSTSVLLGSSHISNQMTSNMGSSLVEPTPVISLGGAEPTMLHQLSAKQQDYQMRMHTKRRFYANAFGSRSNIRDAKERARSRITSNVRLLSLIFSPFPTVDQLASEVLIGTLYAESERESESESDIHQPLEQVSADAMLPRTMTLATTTTPTPTEHSLIPRSVSRHCARLRSVSRP